MTDIVQTRTISLAPVTSYLFRNAINELLNSLPAHMTAASGKHRRALRPGPVRLTHSGHGRSRDATLHGVEQRGGWIARGACQVEPLLLT